jgi:hypothetical protein
MNLTSDEDENIRPVQEIEIKKDKTKKKLKNDDDMGF